MQYHRNAQQTCDFARIPCGAQLISKNHLLHGREDM